MDCDLNHRSLLMNSYQLQQQREQRKEVKNYLNFPTIDHFEEMGWKKFKGDYPQVLGEGGESLWSVGRKPHRPKTGSGDRLLDIPCKVNISFWIFWILDILGPAFGYSVQGEPFLQ